MPGKLAKINGTSAEEMKPKKLRNASLYFSASCLFVSKFIKIVSCKVTPRGFDNYCWPL